MVVVYAVGCACDRLAEDGTLREKSLLKWGTVQADWILSTEEAGERACQVRTYLRARVSSSTRPAKGFLVGAEVAMGLVISACMCAPL